MPGGCEHDHDVYGCKMSPSQHSSVIIAASWWLWGEADWPVSWNSQLSYTLCHVERFPMFQPE